MLQIILASILAALIIWLTGYIMRKLKPIEKLIKDLIALKYIDNIEKEGTWLILEKHKYWREIKWKFIMSTSIKKGDLVPLHYKKGEGYLVIGLPIEIRDYEAFRGASIEIDIPGKFGEENIYPDKGALWSYPELEGGKDRKIEIKIDWRIRLLLGILSITITKIRKVAKEIKKPIILKYKGNDR